jgi:hypothetical protein
LQKLKKKIILSSSHDVVVSSRLVHARYTACAHARFLLFDVMEKRRKERERGSWASPPARKALFANNNANNNATTQWGHAFDTPMGKSTHAKTTPSERGEPDVMRRNWSFGDGDEDDDAFGLNANAKRKHRDDEDDDDDLDANGAFEEMMMMRATPSSAFARALNDASNSGGGRADARRTNDAAFAESLYYHRATVGTTSGRSPVEDGEDDVGVARPLGSPTPMRLSGSPPAPPKKNLALAARAAAYGYTPSMARRVVEADEPSTPAFAGPCAMIPSALDAALGIPSVDGATVRALMTGAEREGLALIDCRFPYEHGGREDSRCRERVFARGCAQVYANARARWGTRSVRVLLRV